MLQIFFSLLLSLRVWFRNNVNAQLEIVALVINSPSFTVNTQNQD